jgi:hypothetical protein
MNQKTRFGYLVIGLIALSAYLSVLVWADNDFPYGVREIQYIQSSRPNLSAYPPASTWAEAGNVTELSLTAISTTKTWQGYFGNITGTLTLEDSSGYVFYNWTALEPKGNIFASVNDTISWAGVVCFDWAGQAITVDTEEARYGIGDDASDGIDETFGNVGLDSDVFVGSLNVSGNATALGFTCHTTNPFQYGLQNNSVDNFENFLLTDGAGALIFATVIENNEFDNGTDIIGYNNQEHDFQLLVAEDGHNGQEDFLTRYYFWAEIQ